MDTFNGRNFGILIAYVLPGFVALWGLGQFSPTIAAWIAATQPSSPSVGGFLFVLLASLAVGMTVSAVRWLVVDTLLHRTGLSAPEWDFSRFQANLPAFEALVENHYRYYQFYANGFIALALTATAWAAAPAGAAERTAWIWVGVLMLEGVLLASARDTLQKYYRKTSRLLGTLESSERSDCDDQRTPRFSPDPQADHQAGAQEIPSHQASGEEE
ncbi:MAG: hypothetical protein K1X74_06315 [Pirellulales bacterium]|nr:hypothetical protein [Pirellulales bacterium]